MPDHNARGWRAAVARVPFIDQKIRALRRTDEIERLQQQLEQERRRANGSRSGHTARGAVLDRPHHG